jgi:hypothetical protein
VVVCTYLYCLGLVAEPGRTDLEKRAAPSREDANLDAVRCGAWSASAESMQRPPCRFINTPAAIHDAALGKYPDSTYAKLYGTQ